MADGQVGGNESVHWIVNADDASDVESVPEGRPKWLQCGIDYHRNPDVGKDFTVRIKIPVSKVRRAIFLRALQARVNAAMRDPKIQLLEVRLPIQTGPIAHTQVQVTWGKETPWYEGLREVHPAKPASVTGTGVKGSNAKGTSAKGTSTRGNGAKGNGAARVTSGITSAASAAVTPAAARSATRKRTTRVAARKS
jgi:hypothetical protein